MSLVKHLLKNDIRRLRLFLFFWIGILLLSAVLSGLKATTVAGDVLRQGIVDMVAGLVMAVQFILLALIVPFLFHSEPLTGTTAFWFTRPLEKKDVLWSKLAFLGLLMVALPIAADLLLYIASGIPATLWLAAMPDLLLKYLGMGLPLAAAAVLTRNFGLYAIVLVVWMFVSVILGAVASIIGMVAEFDGSGVDLALSDSRQLLSALVSILLCAAIIAVQYRTRKVARSYVLLGTEILVAFWVSTYSPWTILPQPTNVLDEAGLARIQATVEDKATSISDAFSRRATDTLKKEIDGELLFSGLPPASYAVATKIVAEFAIGDDTVRSVDLNNDIRFGQYDVNKGVLADAIAPLELVEENRRFFNSQTLLRLDDEEYRKYRDEPGRYSATVAYDVFEYHSVASIPLEVGARHREGGSTFTVNKVLKQSGGCIVIVNEQHFSTLATRQRTADKGRKFLYLLANRKTKETFLPKDDDFSLQFFQTANILEAKGKTLRYSSDGNNANLHPISEAWLEDAELMIVQIRWLGRSKLDVEKKGFSFGEGQFYSQTETSQEEVRTVLSDIKLADPSDRDEVKSYVLKIYEASGGQREKNPGDLQIDMLAKVGNIHLDILIKTSDYNEYYASRAIERIALPTDKELILANLETHGFLVGLVLKFGWHQEAREMLVNGLRTKDDLDPEWVKAVAGFNDPSLYPMLADYFVRGSDKDEIYSAIKDLPGIQLDDTIALAWEAAKKGGSHDYGSMIPVALDHGILDALDFYATTIPAGKELCSHYQDKVHAAVCVHTGQTGSDKELRAWYAQHKGLLRFDREQKMFVVQE